MPSVAALVALIQAQGESLTFEEMTRVLFESADHDPLTPTVQNYGGVSSRPFPNNE